MTNSKIYIFEGYDGAGKSTLINKVKAALTSTSVRVVGRKNEPELMQISGLIEQPEPPISHDAEFLLRLALETERVQLVNRWGHEVDFVFMDRGPISLEAWISYYDLERARYAFLLDQIEMSLGGATIVLCLCQFDICWKRICEKTAQSAKELQGEKINRQWYYKYMQTAEAFERRRFPIVRVPTEQKVDQSVERIIRHLTI